jgi:hypothetical protein
MDARECPAADVAVCDAVARAVKALAEERWSSTRAQRALATASLCQIMRSTVRDAEQAVMSDAEYLAHLGVLATPRTAGELWEHVCESVVPAKNGTNLACAELFREILRNGPLARRILDRVGTPILPPARFTKSMGNRQPALLRDGYFKVRQVSDCSA